MEGGSNSNSCLMGFGDNNSVGDDGLCPMIITMPHHHHQHQNFTTNTQYLPLPPPPTSSGASSPITHPTPTTGCFFMETDHGALSSSSSSSAVKAKIMAHPHYHRLLAAYVNCQKVKSNLAPDLQFVARFSSQAAHHVNLRNNNDNQAAVANWSSKENLLSVTLNPWLFISLFFPLLSS